MDKKLPPFPVTLNIEPTNFCNLQCIMCPGAYALRKKGYISEQLWEKVIKEVANNGGLEKLYLHKDGEPLLHPMIIEFIREAKKAGVKKTVLTTNGSLLNESASTALITSGLDEIRVSINASCPETYSAIHGANILHQVINNVRLFLKIRASYHTATPLVSVSMVDMSINNDEKKAFINYWKDQVDAVNIFPLIIMNRLVDFIPYDRVSWQKRRSCPFLWYTMVVQHDGSVVPCCADYRGEMILGDITCQSLKEIWASERYNAIRDKHRSNQYKKLPTCMYCNYWKELEASDLPGNPCKKIGSSPNYKPISDASFF